MTDPSPPLAHLTPRELLALYSNILTELIRRDIVWSRNAPAGDYAELLVARAFGDLARRSVKSWDVRVGEELIQIKCRVVDRLSKKTQTFSPFRSFDFDSCIFIVLDSVTYDVMHAVQVERDAVRDRASHSAWIAGSRLTVRNVLAITDATDVSAALRKAQEDVDAS